MLHKLIAHLPARHTGRRHSTVPQTASDLKLLVEACEPGSEDLGINLCRYIKAKTLEEVLYGSGGPLSEDFDARRHEDAQCAEALSECGKALWHFYKESLEAVYLENCCKAEGESIKYTARSAPHLAVDLGKLSRRLFQYYQKYGDVDYLEASVKVGAKAQSMTSPDSDRDTFLFVLENYADALQSRAIERGDMNDLNRAIEKSELMVQNSETDEDRICYLNNYANRLETRFDLVGRLDDLTKAISVAKRALVMAMKKDSFIEGAQFNLGLKLLKLSEREPGLVSNFDEGMVCIQKAVETGDQANHGEIPTLWMLRLSEALHEAYRRTHDLEALEKAIQWAERSVEKTNPGERERPFCLRNLALLLGERAKRTADFNDMPRAISLCIEAVDATRDDHPEKPALLLLLGKLGRLRAIGAIGFECIRADGKRWNPEFEDLIIDCYTHCLDSQHGRPITRMIAAAELIALHEDRGELAQAVEAGKKVVALSKKSITRSMNREDQEVMIGKFSGLAAETCSLFLRAGYTAAEALEALETGRAAILGLLIEDKSDITRLKVTHEKEAERFERLRDQVKELSTYHHDLPVPERMIALRDRRVEELEQCISIIRKLPGQERFLLGPTSTQMMECAVKGAIAVINVADYGSDALIVTPSTITSIPLPELTSEKVRDWVRNKPTEYHSGEQEGIKNKAYCKFLEWLWSSCVKHVLQYLESSSGIFPSTTLPLPRIWWIGTGVGSSLPFHAAGIHIESSMDNTYSRAISSYTPTIKSLFYGRTRSVSLQNQLLGKKQKILAVLMPTTPGEHNLAAIEEWQAVKEAFRPEDLQCKGLFYPFGKEVLYEMPDYDIVHFACHAKADPRSPSMGGLTLQKPYKENGTPVADRLTVQQIMEANLGHARMAYLSACSTAENKVEDLADEVIHLASAFQVTGFADVIGSLWPAEDSISLELAKEVYQRLAKHFPLRDGDAALALHEAVLHIRGNRRKRPLEWAQFVHMGV